MVDELSFLVSQRDTTSNYLFFVGPIVLSSVPLNAKTLGSQISTLFDLSAVVTTTVTTGIGVSGKNSDMIDDFNAHTKPHIPANGNISSLLFVAAARGIGLKCRLVGSLHPIALSFKKKRISKVSSSTSSSPSSYSSSVDESLARDETDALRLWAEVFSEQDEIYVSVDPVMGLVNRDKEFEKRATQEQHQISYVVACDPGIFLLER